VSLADLPVDGAPVDAAPVEPAPNNLPEGGDPGRMIARLEAAPAIPGVTGRARAVFAAGRAVGTRADVFTKVGDCITDTFVFLVPFGEGGYDLGPHGELEATIAHFTSTPPREGVANSFVNPSVAANSGFYSPDVLDPTWANGALCWAGESPLACEYRLTRPSVAIITFGLIDMQAADPDQFRAVMRRVVQTSINRGVVPVLTTIPLSPDYPMYHSGLVHNVITLDVAQEYDVPLINVWLAARELPNNGLEQDNFHLSSNGQRWIAFGSDEFIYGHALRNLLTLQTLDVLRRDLLAP
jgi:hypothetical protein